MAKTPLLVHINNNIVYDRLLPGVLPNLQELNPTDPDYKGRKPRHHQFLLGNVGQLGLKDYFLRLISIMRISKDWGVSHRHLDVAFPKKL